MTGNWQILGQSHGQTSFLVCDETMAPRIMHVDPPIIWPQSPDGLDEFNQTWYQVDPAIDLADQFSRANIIDSFDGFQIFETEEDIAS